MINHQLLITVFLCGTVLTGCNQYNVGIRSFYNLETDSYKDAEARIVQLYREGRFITNSDSLTSLVNHSTRNSSFGKFRNEWTKDGFRKHSLGTIIKQDFVVYQAENQFYYYYEITNCGGLSGCQVHVHSIVRKSPSTGGIQRVRWEEAGPMLREFEDKVLPAILKKISSNK